MMETYRNRKSASKSAAKKGKAYWQFMKYKEKIEASTSALKDDQRAMMWED